MDRNAYRDEDDTDQPDTYWRRRVLTLVAGLALLGILAWAFSGGGGKPAHPAAATSSPATSITPAAAYSGDPSSSGATSPAGSPVSAGLTAPATGSSSSSGSSSSGGFWSASSAAKSAGASPPAARTSNLAGLPAAGRTSPGRGTRTASAPATATGTADPSGQPLQATVEPGGGCAPSAVVLSLFASKTSYSSGQDPQFSVYAVSTGAQPCTVAIGPAKLQVLVMSSGRIVWNSADCAKASSTRTVKLKRGVPVTETISWNRSVSLPGCQTLASSAPAGTYQVQARTGSVSSPVRTFKLVH
jgi:hypothetical protein